MILDQSFKDYLQKSSNIQGSTLDLSEKSVIEIIKEKVNIRKTISPRYGSNYSTVYKLLKDLEDQSGVKIMPHQVTDVFWNNIIQDMINKGYAMSTIRNICNILRSSLRWSTGYGVKLSPSFNNVKLPSMHGDEDKFISLTQDEVSYIYHFDINSIPNVGKRKKNMLIKTKDMFVLSCNLGQRFSDMVRIDPTCFNKNIFTITQLKTGNKAVVNIDKFGLDPDTTYEILRRYNYNPPMKCKIGTYSKYLRELIINIGDRFNEEILVENKILGKIITTKIPKWKLITSHTARRTFVTINVDRGIGILEIRKATGHKSQGAFERYIYFKRIINQKP